MPNIFERIASRTNRFRQGLRAKPYGEALDTVLNYVPGNLPYSMADMQQEASQGDLAGMGLTTLASVLTPLKAVRGAKTLAGPTSHLGLSATGVAAQGVQDAYVGPPPNPTLAAPAQRGLAPMQPRKRALPEAMLQPPYSMRLQGRRIQKPAGNIANPRRPAA